MAAYASTLVCNGQSMTSGTLFFFCVDRGSLFTPRVAPSAAAPQHCGRYNRSKAGSGPAGGHRMLPLVRLSLGTGCARMRRPRTYSLVAGSYQTSSTNRPLCRPNANICLRWTPRLVASITPIAHSRCWSVAAGAAQNSRMTPRISSHSDPPSGAGGLGDRGQCVRPGPSSRPCPDAGAPSAVDAPGGARTLRGTAGRRYLWHSA